MKTEFILYVKNQKKSKDFYSFLLDFQPVLDVPGMTEFSLNENCKLGIMPEDGIYKLLKDKICHPKMANKIPRCELYLRVIDPERYLKRAIEAGAQLLSPLQERDWNEKVAYISDFDGHIIALAEEI